MKENNSETNELCVNCGRKMEMYYTPWCPLCDKPKVENQPVLNYIQAMRYLEILGYEGVRDRITSKLLDHDRYHNDCLTYLYFIDDKDEINYDKEYIFDLKILKKVFNIQTDYVILDISY